MRALPLRDEWIAMLAGGLSLALILGALGFQYLGGMAPCEMCHWQRWPHIAASIIGLGGGILAARGVRIGISPRELAAAAVALIAISGLIGAYQQGMQWHLLPGPEACSVDHPYIMGSHDAPVVRCDVVGWGLFGISLAGYNALLSLAAAGTAAFFMAKNRS